jgi:hypothetical protein
LLCPLQTRAAETGLHHECTAVLDDAAAAGLTVVRLWAFADGADQWNALQVRSSGVRVQWSAMHHA